MNGVHQVVVVALLIYFMIGGGGAPRTLRSALLSWWWWCVRGERRTMPWMARGLGFGRAFFHFMEKMRK